MAKDSTVSWTEDALGPVSHVRRFDFTLTFEQVILSIIPSTVLLLAGPPRLLYLTRCRSKTSSQQKKYLYKLVTSFTNLVLQLSLLVLWSVSPSLRTSSSIPAASLSVTNAVIIIGLSYVEDRNQRGLLPY
ncbi:hypothetical protein RU639_004769 [Aspergillus parasiticus]